MIFYGKESFKQSNIYLECNIPRKDWTKTVFILFNLSREREIYSSSQSKPQYLLSKEICNYCCICIHGKLLRNRISSSILNRHCLNGQRDVFYINKRFCILQKKIDWPFLLCRHQSAQAYILYDHILSSIDNSVRHKQIVVDDRKWCLTIAVYEFFEGDVQIYLRRGFITKLEAYSITRSEKIWDLRKRMTWTWTKNASSFFKPTSTTTMRKSLL